MSSNKCKVPCDLGKVGYFLLGVGGRRGRTVGRIGETEAEMSGAVRKEQSSRGSTPPEARPVSGERASGLVWLELGFKELFHGF